MITKVKYILPILGDFANGVFAVAISAWLFDFELLLWHFVVAFMIALLPDLDALPEVLQYGQVGQSREDTALDTNHRTYLHYPAVYIVFGLLIFKWHSFWGATFLIGTTLHFVRDMLGTGWGVKALWPVTNKNYRFFTQGNSDFKPVAAMTDEQTSRFAEDHGNSSWLEETYLRVTWISGIEYTLFLFSLIVMWSHLVY